MPNMTEQIAAIRAADAQAEDRLEFLSRVPTADTAAAQRAVDGLRLEILDEFHRHVREALGSPAAPRVAAVPPEESAEPAA